MGLTDLTGDAGKKKAKKGAGSAGAHGGLYGPNPAAAIAAMFPGASVTQIGPNGTSITTPPRNKSGAKKPKKPGPGPGLRKTFGED